MRITRTLAAAFAIAALVAPAAQGAQPADMHASTAQALAQARQKQDARSPDVARPLPGPPTWPANPQPIEPTVSVEPAGGWGIDWASTAIGVTASLLLMAGFVALGGRRTRRLHRPRVTA